MNSNWHVDLSQARGKRAVICQRFRDHHVQIVTVFVPNPRMTFSLHGRRDGIGSESRGVKKIKFGHHAQAGWAPAAHVVA